MEEETAKDDEVRYVPISARLAAVLDMAKTNPAGREWPPTAYVFGQLGEQVASVERPGNLASCAPTVTNRNGSRTASWPRHLGLRCAQSICTSHDLRHVAGSRWLEAGMPLHQIKELLGHANISQTDTYLALAGSRSRNRCSGSTPRVANPWQSRHR